MSLKNELLERMQLENLSQREISKITKLSNNTISRFLKGESVNQNSLEIIKKFVAYEGKYKSTERMINIGQVKIPKNQYDYIKRRAEDQGGQVIDVVRAIIESVVENDYLWKSFSDHINLTERAVNSSIENKVIPFIKMQDKNLEQIEKRLELTIELLLRTYEDYNDVVEKSNQVFKEEIEPRVEDRIYKRRRNKD